MEVTMSKPIYSFEDTVSSETLSKKEYWTWYNEDGYVHRDVGPAMIERWSYRRGNATKTTRAWYQNGRMWNKDRDKPALIQLYKGPTKSTEERFWFKRPDVPMKQVTYESRIVHDYAANPSTYKSIISYLLNPEANDSNMHSFNGEPALVKYMDDVSGTGKGPSSVIMEWRYMGRKHRQEGPAVIEQGGRNRREYWLKGIQFDGIDNWLKMTDLSKSEKVALKLELGSN